MKASRLKIADVVARQTLADGSRAGYAKEVAAYLLLENRTNELDSLLRDIQSSWIEDGFVEILARSVHAIDDAAKSDILAKIKLLYPRADRFKITEIIDSSVIGGVRLSIADSRLDLSIEAKLNKFKQLTTVGKE